MNPRLVTLCAMLRTMRPMGSRAESAFRARYLDTLPNAWTDTQNNIHVILLTADGQSSHVLWSSHTDTVHRVQGRQAIHYDAARQTITLGRRAHTSNCLGADDTVGVWIMREMILAGVPGHYVFHFGEERGGIGSSGIVAEQPELFDDIWYAIALDRGGTTDVITHQASVRCCSDAFAQSLALALQHVAPYSPSDWGVYTDTAEYVGIVPECTNLSVGYDRQHSAREYVDADHALRLCTALCAFDVADLVLGDRDADDDADYATADYTLPAYDDRPLYEYADLPRVVTKQALYDASEESEWLETLTAEDRKFWQYLRAR